MHLPKLILSPLLLLCIWTSATAQDQERDDDGLPEWELVSSSPHIRVYRRPSPTSSIDEVRIKAAFNTSLTTFLDLIGAVSRYPEWVYKCSEAKTISKSSDRDLVYYARTDFPWPLQDRDLIVHSTRTTDTITGVVTSTSVARADRLAAVDGVVRIQQFSSVWKIIPVSEVEVRIDYQVTTEPGGKLPDWAVNLGITNGPRKTMEGLRKLVAETKRDKPSG